MYKCGYTIYTHTCSCVYVLKYTCVCVYLHLSTHAQHTNTQVSYLCVCVFIYLHLFYPVQSIVKLNSLCSVMENMENIDSRILFSLASFPCKVPHTISSTHFSKYFMSTSAMRCCSCSNGRMLS